MILKRRRGSISKNEKKLENAIYKRFQIIEKEMISLLKNTIKSEKDGLIDVLLTLGLNEAIQEIKDISVEVYIAEAIRTADQVGVGISMDLLNKGALSYISSREQFILGTKETTKKNLVELFSDIIQGGKTLDEGVKEMQSTYWLSRRRAELIATNELGHAYVQGTRATLKRLSATENLDIKKRWNNVGDARVTKGCSHNENIGWVPENYDYPNIDGLGGGDAPPRFIGCRCTLDYDVTD